MCFFDLDISHLVNNHFITDSHMSMGVAVTETAEAYSNIQDGTSSKNSNVIDLLTIFTKSPIPDT